MITHLRWHLKYFIIDPSTDTAAAAIENIADAVTHARFVGTDPGSDEVVLMKILYVRYESILLLISNSNYCILENDHLLENL